MSLRDPTPYSMEELQEIADKASRVIPRYREQNAILKETLDEKQNELKQCKYQLEIFQKELQECKKSNQEFQKLLEFYKTEQIQDQKVIKKLYSVLALVVFLVVGFFVISSSNKPTADFVASSPTTAPAYNFQSSIGKAAAAKSTSAKSSEIYVWIPQSGKRYHDSERCSGMKSPKYVPLSEAKRLGYTACATCDPPY